jgi:hypothetical protein
VATKGRDALVGGGAAELNDNDEATADTPKLPRPSKWARAGIVLVAVALVLLLVQIAVTTYRTIVPRPPTPYFVCVYVTEHGSTTVTGSAPCEFRGEQ